MASTSLRASVVAAVLCGLIFSAGNARASERDEMTDLFLFGQFASEDDTTATIFGVDVDVEYEESFGGGFGIGRNVNDFINLNGTLLIGEAEVTAEALGFTTSEDATLIAPDFNVDWNILDADVTPFITAGAGLMFFLGDESDTEFSAGAGVGVRWDVSHDTFMKVWYRARWFELDETDDALMLHTFNVGIGIMR